jgi:hypothetical protein
MMIIIEDERRTCWGGFCDNCKQEKIAVRRVKALDIFTRQYRGFFTLCLDCFGPRIFWKNSPGGQIKFSPVERPNSSMKLTETAAQLISAVRQIATVGVSGVYG